MKETVASRKDVDEGPKLGDVDDLAVIHGTNLSLGWESNLLDPFHGSRECLAIIGGDAHDADTVGFIDLDVGTGLFLELTDDGALGPNDLADLVLRNLDCLNPRRPLVQLGAGL